MSETDFKSETDFEKRIRLRLQYGCAYMICEDCGSKLYEFDGSQDRSSRCPKRKSNGKCGYDG